jgi:hypothetical protein
MSEEKVEPTNCRFCKNKIICDEKSYHCKGFSLDDIPENKLRDLEQLVSRIKQLDWSDDRIATIEIIQIEIELSNLDVWYRLFP